MLTVQGDHEILVELEFAVIFGRSGCLTGMSPELIQGGRACHLCGASVRVEETRESFLSVVIPAKNEAASLVQLVEEITSVLRPLTRHGQEVFEAFEIIVVDDGSTDRTQSVLQELTAAYPELTALRLATAWWPVSSDDGGNSRCQRKLDCNAGR